MKRFCVFLTASLALFILFHTAEPSSAFTLKELDTTVQKYAQKLARADGVQKAFCEMDGSVITGIGSNSYSTVRYVQGDLDVALELRPTGNLIMLFTINPEFKLPGNIGVGDPISRVMVAALIPGDYSREVKDSSTTHHKWVRDGKVTIIAEVGGKIAEIAYGDTNRQKGVTVNWDYARYLSDNRPSAGAEDEGDSGEGEGDDWDEGDGGVDDSEDKFFSSLFTNTINFLEGANEKLTLCTSKGRVITNEEYRERTDAAIEARRSGVEYHQGRKSASVWRKTDSGSKFVLFRTEDPELAFYGGVKIGGGISAALAPGIVIGEYKVEPVSNGKLHTWTSGSVVIKISEVKGKIVNISSVDTEEMDKITVRNELLSYLR
ncbi:MAG: hypothetical protein LBI74_07135 [Synergistaceae bacterium]|nr:hypothetical protein [Synergistaceae bacterium]